MSVLERPREQFTSSLLVRCPESFRTAVDLAAKRSVMTTAAWMRDAALKELKAQGIDPGALAEVNRIQSMGSLGTVGGNSAHRNCDRER